MAGREVCLGQLGYRVSLAVSNCGRALVASRLSGWTGPNFTARPWPHSTRSMGRIPLFSLSGPDNCWYTPSRGSPCWSLGSSPSGGSSRFWLAWGLCTVLLFPGPLPPPTCPESPVPRTQCQRGRQPCPALPCLAHALPCHASPCPGFPSPTWKVPARPPLPSDPTQPVQSSPVARGRRLLALRSVCLSLFPPSPPPPPFGLVARLLSFPGLTLASPSPLAQFQWEISRGFLLGLDRPLL